MSADVKRHPLEAHLLKVAELPGFEDIERETIRFASTIVSNWFAGATALDPTHEPKSRWTVWRRCNKCRSESDIAQNIDRCPACKAAWVGREFERAGDEGHDDRLEPDDSTIAALQTQVVSVRGGAKFNVELRLMALDFKSSHEALDFAAYALCVYDKLKSEGK